MPPIVGKLGEAQGQGVDTIALTLTDDLEDDIRIRPVSTPRAVHFTAMDGSRQETISVGNSDMGNRIGLLLRALILLSLALPGCSSQETPRPVWEQAKIGELAVISPPKTPLPSLAAQIKLEVLAFEIPTENVSQLDEMWSPLTSKGLRFKDHAAFRANGFRVGKGVFGELATASSPILACSQTGGGVS